MRYFDCYCEYYGPLMYKLKIDIAISTLQFLGTIAYSFLQYILKWDLSNTV